MLIRATPPRINTILLGFLDLGGKSRYLTYCFLRLANLDNGVFERLGRYEAALWRQVVQTLFALRSGTDKA